MCEDTCEVHADIHEADDHRADEHCTMQALRILIADAAHNGLRQGNRTNAHENPLRKIKPPGHMPGRERLQHLRMVRLNIRHDGIIAAACLQYIIKKQHDADHHHDRTKRICQRHRTEAADGRIDNDCCTEQDKPRHIAIARNRLKKLRTAYELRCHRTAEKEYDDESRHIRKQIRLETFTDDIHHRHCIELARKQCHAFAENTQNKKNCRNLYNCHINPAKTDLPGHTRPAYERAHRAVRRNRRHRKHEAAEIMIANKILLHEILHKTSPLLFIAYKKTDEHHHAHKCQKRQKCL